MNFDLFFKWAGSIGIAVAIWAYYFAWCCEHDSHPLSELLAKFRKLPWYAQVFALCYLGGWVLHGGSKTNTPPSGVEGGTNAPPVMMAMAPRLLARQPSTGFSEAQIGARAAIVGIGTNETHDFSMPDGAHVVERWRLRGAANERVGIVESVEVDTFGRIRTPERVFAPLGMQLGMVPMANWGRIGAASLCWWMHTASNSLVVCWQNALLNRDTNTPVSVQAEFFDDGKFEYRYDLSSIGEAATNVLARVGTTNGVEGVALGLGVTSVRGHLLGEEDGTVPDKDGDGVSTYDEIYVYGTDPELPDTDGDGRTDGEEAWNGDDPLVGDVTDAEIAARIAAGVTNEEIGIVSGELRSTKLWDGFVLRDDPGTNVLYTRTFEIDRQEGWTSFYLSGRGENWCSDGGDAMGGWSLIGCEVEWTDDAGASGTATASPSDDTLCLPLGTEATSVTITLRAVGTAGVQQQVGAARRASPRPVYLLEYTPRIEFQTGLEIEGDDGNAYCVIDDLDDATFIVDDSNRPRRAPVGVGEATAADFRMPSGPGVYTLPLVDMVEPDVHPLLLAAPGGGGNGDSGCDGGDRYLVIIDPWVSYGSAHYGCWHDYPYDWGWYGYWCDCEPDCGCGVEGHSAVSCYIDWYDEWECSGVVKVGGVEVWREYADHIVWSCDHDHEPEPYCPCGCDENCQYCSCIKSDGPSQGSIRFRVGLGTDYDDQKIGFAWFESDGPVQVTPRLFEVDSRPDVYVREQNSGNSVYVTAYETHGRDLAIAALSNGVSVAVMNHGAAQAFETWEVTNVSNLNSVVRLVKRDRSDAVVEDWTYSCTWQTGEWVWEVTDNVDHGFTSDEPLVTVENGTNWVYGADGRLERFTVCTNGEETVIRTFGYDEDGRLVLVDDGTNGCVTIAYDDAGNISEMTGPEGTLRATHDESGAITNLDTSAWHGPVPNPRPPLMAPRTGLLGAPNESGMTPGDALMHYLHGGGTPLSMPFDEIDTGWLTPTEFECVRNFVSCCRLPDDYWVSGTRVISTKGAQQYYLGRVTIQLEGWITYLGNCNWQFNGTMTALDDTYDFNAAMRGRMGETLTAIGRWLLTENGRPFTISFTGTKPLIGAGHCNAK